MGIKPTVKCIVRIKQHKICRSIKCSPGMSFLAGAQEMWVLFLCVWKLHRGDKDWAGFRRMNKSFLRIKEQYMENKRWGVLGVIGI